MLILFNPLKLEGFPYTPAIFIQFLILSIEGGDLRPLTHQNLNHQNYRMTTEHNRFFLKSTYQHSLV